MREEKEKIAYWITGFVDGEGCFSVSFSKRAKMKLNIEVRCSFSVSQHQRSLKSLQLIEEYFKCGGIRFSKKDRTYKYEIRDRKQLEKIVEHFKKYKLKTAKKEDFEKFVKIYEKVKRNEHVQKEGLKEIIELAYTMNESGKRKYAKEYLLRLL